jgi:branched-chain amino acid transport system substrate-binding protein
MSFRQLEDIMSIKNHLVCAGLALGLAAWLPAAMAQKKYDPGASDTEIKIGQTMPYSGPASAYGALGRAEAAYFKKINAEGGINGRKIVFVSLDDGYSPSKTVEATRRLVERDEVLLMFGSLGTATNTAVQAYLNARHVPQLFIASGASKWNDPLHFPWTMGQQVDYQTEARIYARHILQNRPNAKIGALYQNDDFGKDYLKGMKEGLGEKAAKMIVAELSYEVTDPTIDSQIVQLQASGADVFFDVTSPKFAAMAIRKVNDVGWKPVHCLSNVSNYVAAVLVPAGLENSVGLISSQSSKDPTDPRWADDPRMLEWRAFMKEYYPEGNLADILNLSGYGAAFAMAHVLSP